jgi:hypothetical protein
VRGIERGLLISEEILRHLVIVLEDRGAGAEDEELVPAVAERQPEDGELEPEARREPVEAEPIDYESEIADAPGAEETDQTAEPEPAEQPLAQA